MMEVTKHKVVSVRQVELDEPIDVYDMEVDEHHNFCVSCDDGTSVVVHNCKAFNKPMEEVTKAERSFAKGAVFGLLYGESERSFAETFTHGDIDRAKEIFNSIFTAFPGIKTYIEKAHQQYRDHKKVTLLTDRFIDLTEIERQNGNDTDRILRQSQNYVVQGCVPGDTKIKLLDGTSRTIQDLAESQDEFYVYAYDKDAGKIVPAYGCNAHKTRMADTLIEITLSNGQIVRCTENHLIMCRDGSYVEAKDLVAGSSLMPYGTEECYITTHLTILHYGHPIPVYDITVPKYSNFVITDDNRTGIVVHNSCCDIAGLILYKICEFIKNNNMKSKPFCFIHDSIEISVPPSETFRMIDALTPLFNQYPRDAFEVPMASDIVLGVSMGAECEVVEHIHDNDYQHIELTLNGFKDDLDDLYNNWLPVYKSVTYTDDESSITEERFPRSGLFQKKVTFSEDMGKTKIKLNRKFIIEV